MTYSIVIGISKIYYGVNFQFDSNSTGKIPSNLSIDGWNATKHINSTGLASVMWIMNNIANLGFTFMIPIIVAFIGFSIAARPAMISSFVTAFALTQPSILMWWDYGGKFILDNNTGHAGFSWTLLGALYGGFTGRYMTKALLKIKFPSWFTPAMPMVIIPFLSTALVAIPTVFFLAAPIGVVVGEIDSGLVWLASHRKLGLIIGAIAGAMVGFDLGGSINKIAVLVATSLISTTTGAGGDSGALGPCGAAIPCVLH